MLNFIHRNLDRNYKEPTAVLAGLIDFSKAFNRMNHNSLITILSDMNIPTCALCLIKATSPSKECVCVTIVLSLLNSTSLVGDPKEDFKCYIIQPPSQ